MLEVRGPKTMFTELEDCKNGDLIDFREFNTRNTRVIRLAKSQEATASRVSKKISSNFLIKDCISIGKLIKTEGPLMLKMESMSYDDGDVDAENYNNIFYSYDQMYHCFIGLVTGTIYCVCKMKFHNDWNTALEVTGH